MLSRLATFCYRHRRLVLVAWLVLLVGLSVVSRRAGDAYTQVFRLPTSDSQQATDLLRAKFPDTGGSFSGGELVFAADAGVTDPGVRQRLTSLFDEVRAVPGVHSVRSPYDEGPAAQFQIAPGGRIGFATITFDASGQSVPESTRATIREEAATAGGNGLQVELGGQVFQSRPHFGSEGIGLLAATLILLVAFGSIVAMGLPILTAMFGLGVGFSVVALLAHVTSVPQFSTQLAAMIGLGVGIDYALFIVTRYRQGLHAGLDPAEATRVAIDTAGRAVFFAGCTVVISLTGMLIVGIEFVRGLGLSAAGVVAITMAASLTLLPALLGFAGRNIDRLRIPGLNRTGGLHREGFWFRWSKFLQKHPWPFAVGGLITLLLLASPVLSMRLGSSDAGNLPTSSTARRAYDLKAEGYGPGASGPLIVVAQLPPATGADTVTAAFAPLSEVPGVAAVFPPRLNPAGDTAQFVIVPTTSAQDERTSDLIRRLRTDVLPRATAGTGITVHIGGITAAFDDLADRMQQRLPVFIGAVLVLSFLLLMLVFRSILVPVKAVIMNVLSIGAAYGVMVAVFQKGWGAGALGIGGAGPIESFLPMMMFAILFGLSMDYEVFLLTRIKEEYDRTGDNAGAVADGLSATARVITAAAFIMVTVFGTFVFVDDRVVKAFGLGLAVAVFLDATVVRLVLVPATMELLGRANWWFPRWLRWLPEVHVEGTDVPTGVEDLEIAGLPEPETTPAP